MERLEDKWLIMVRGGVDAGRRWVLSALLNSLQLSPPHHFQAEATNKVHTTESKAIHEITITIGEDTKERPKTECDIRKNFNINECSNIFVSKNYTNECSNIIVRKN